MPWVAPDTPQGVALWLTHLGSSAEQTAPMLARLSERELLAASFDPPGHGRRSAGGEPWELAQEVLGVFRRRMWPLAGRSVLESLRVLDWVDDHFGVAGPRWGRTTSCSIRARLTATRSSSSTR